MSGVYDATDTGDHAKWRSNLHCSADTDTETVTSRSSGSISSQLLSSGFVSGTQIAIVLGQNRRLREELEETKKQLENANRELEERERIRRAIEEDAEVHTRYWLPDEHERFLFALQKFGNKDMKAVAEHVGTRSVVQVRTHAQKYFAKMQKEGQNVGGAAKPPSTHEEAGSSPSSAKRAQKLRLPSTDQAAGSSSSSSAKRPRVPSTDGEAGSSSSSSAKRARKSRLSTPETPQATSAPHSPREADKHSGEGARSCAPLHCPASCTTKMNTRTSPAPSDFPAQEFGESASVSCTLPEQCVGIMSVPSALCA